MTMTLEPAQSREQLLETVYRTNYRSLLGYVLKFTLGDRARAEDIVQETMVRAWQHIGELKIASDAARPWLFTVARRIAIDTLRARASRPAEVNGELLAFKATPRDDIDHAITAMDVRTALEVLPPEQKDVLINVYLRGISTEETAALMGIPVGTVKSRTFNALRTIRRTMEQNKAR